MAAEPVRRIFDPNKPIELHTDASCIGIGAILIQDKHPVGHYSRKLCDSETRYTPTELECLAIVDAIPYFRIYLEGTHFKVVTDHSALQWLLKFQNSKRRLFHWSEHMSLHLRRRAPHKHHMAHVEALPRASVSLILTA